MRRHLNIAYLQSEGSWAHLDGDNLAVELERREIGRAPLHLLGGVVAIGRISISPHLMAACAERGVTITHLDRNGRFLARIEGPVAGNVLVRRRQYRLADDDTATTKIAVSLVVGKAANQRAVLRRALRDHGYALAESERVALETAERRLTHLVRKSAHATSADEARGYEGEVAAIYFAAFDHCVRVEDPAFCFTGRNRRPPRDPVNALLSFLYTLLTHDCRSALETHGLDPAVGFLHRDRPGRPSLALDLAEEFRPILADRLVLSMVNRKQLTARDFVTAETGAVRLADDARKRVIVAWQERKQDEIRHPFLEQRLAWGLAPIAQAHLLARHLRDDIDGYPPFLWK